MRSRGECAGEGCFTPARDPRRTREEQGGVPDAALRRTGSESRQRQRGGQHRRALREDRRRSATATSAFPTSQVVHAGAGLGSGRLQPGGQRHQPGHGHPVLAHARIAGVQQRRRCGEHARQELRRTGCRASTCASGSRTSSSCASATRRRFRGRTSACCATRWPSMHRPSTPAPLAVSDQERARCRSRVTTSCSMPKPVTRGSSPWKPTTSTCPTSSTSARAAPSRWACSTSKLDNAIAYGRADA